LNKYHVTAVILLVSFIILAAAVSVKDSPITSADKAAFLAINNAHIQSLNEFMILLSQYGREAFWIITIILLFIFGGWSGKKTAVVMAISMLVLIPIGTIAKDVVARERPIIPQSDFLVTSDKESSFPSGHATIVSAGAAVAFALFRNNNRKIAISIGLAAEATLVCISRIYVGGHYPTDVLGGILLGVGVSFVFVGIVFHIEKLLLPIAKIMGLKKE
jgi:membrane-associated phospholipid phosphatase